MGKAIAILVFLVLLAGFAIIRSVAVGAKAAYEAVFDPGANDQRVRKIIENCFYRVNHYASTRLNNDRSNLAVVIAELTPMTQSFIMDEGYRVSSDAARNLVCKAMIAGGFASEAQLNAEFA
jgi:hypothetical protein